jgi:hypothetical protein
LVLLPTLVWQSYGDAAREMIANSSPQLRWLAPQNCCADRSRHGRADCVLHPSPDVQQLKAMSLVSRRVRQSVEQLAAAQQQMTDDDR